MKRYLSQYCFSAVVITTLFAFTMTTNADDPDKTPSAVSILKKFTEVSGGADKFKSVKSIRLTGKFSIPSMNLEGPFVQHQVSPNRVLQTIEMGQAGNHIQGTDGKIGWEISTMEGPRLLNQNEIERLQDEANMTKYIDPEKFYKETKVVGTEEINGEKCFKLELTKQNDEKATEFYSVKTGLHVASRNLITSPRGEFDVRSNIRGYKTVEGIKFPTKIELDGGDGNLRVVTFDKIEVNPEFDAKTFNVPAEIQTLVDEGKKTMEDSNDK